jgi:hypothetical protein
LQYQALSAGQWSQIEAHWLFSRGRFRTFALPGEVWSGTADVTVFTPAGYSWRWVKAPNVAETPTRIADGTGALFYVSVDLEMVPEAVG